MPPEFTLSIAALHASLHTLRTIANAGLISPTELDESLDGVTETLENLPPELLAMIQKNLDPLFADMKKAAVANWKGA